jgi:hypothetical protein
MTGNSEHETSAPNLTDMAKSFFVEQDECFARAEAIRLANKTALFDALAATGIGRAIVTFDGCGDSGQIEDITFYIGDDVVPAPATEPIWIVSSSWGSEDRPATQMTIEQALEHLAYDFLSQTHSGWENDDGAYGAFVFNTADRSILLDHNDRYTAVENHQHVL